MRITKIKNLKKGITIEWRTRAKNGDWIPHTDGPIKEQAPEEFYNALDGLEPHLIKLEEIEKIKKDLVNVTGATLSYNSDDDEDDMKVILHGYRTYEKSKGCNNLNTSSKDSKQKGEPTAEQNIIPDGCLEVLKNLIEQAKLFVKGERSQIEMDLKEIPDEADI